MSARGAAAHAPDGTELRGPEMGLVIAHELWERARDPANLTAGESRVKAQVFKWFMSLSRPELERVRRCS